MPPARLEIALKDELFDPAGAGLAARAKDYLGLEVKAARRIEVLTFDLDLTKEELDQVAQEILTNPVTQHSSFDRLTPLSGGFDWIIWVGLRPGVKDNPGDTAKEAIENHFQRTFGAEEKVFTSQMYALAAPALGREEVESIASELLANDLIQCWRVISASQWKAEGGVGLILPKVELGPRPTFTQMEIPTEAELLRLSAERSLALHPADAPVIRAYFLDPARAAERAKTGLGPGPTDVELEFISQARSDHCNHNTFGGLFDYRDLVTGERERIDSLFATYIKAPTLAIAAQKDWVVSVLWDNAGVAAFDQDWLYTITGETHNSPSNMEAYGGALTGIVGVYRDPLGTGLGSKLILGAYGYCVGPRDYAGPLMPRLHPSWLLDGVFMGVKDGGNASGVPTGFGLVHFDEGYLGKCLVYVTALGIMPRQAGEKKTWQKKPNPSDLIVMAGGRVGVDGIHGVTAASESYSEKTPAGHVQIGDPYTQKKLHDFLLEARDEGLMTFLTDNGGGGLSSSVGESARLSGENGGAEVWLDKVPLKYPGLQLWEIWVSESQERMTAAVPPENKDRFFELAAKHAVEATVIGRYTDTGKLHLKSEGTTCAYLEVGFTQKGFPQWRFSAEWLSPEARGLSEPVLSEPTDHALLLSQLLASPNLAAKNWITRQYDHEVQGGAVIKPLIGLERDVPADAVVYRPVLTSPAGLCFTQCLNPSYGRIDAYHMTAAMIDEAVRRLLAVGADLFRLGAVDNFCWPNIQFDPATNPDGKYKAAQLVRSCQALAFVCQAYGIPLLSGKDSMYVDGLLAGPFGERRKVSGPPTLQIAATSVIDDVRRATTPEPKAAGDFVYLLGFTGNELGGSALYDFLGYVGLNVPVLDAQAAFHLYRAYQEAHQKGLIRSAKALSRGGLAAAAALCCFAAVDGDRGLGLELNLKEMATAGQDEELGRLARLYSESCGRLLLTVARQDANEFEEVFEQAAAVQRLCLLGEVILEPRLRIKSGREVIIDAPTAELKAGWLATFGGLR